MLYSHLYSHLSSGKVIIGNFLRADAYTYSSIDKHIAEIKKEVVGAHSLGLPAQYQKNIKILPFPIKAAIKFTNQASFHPRKFLLALAEKIVNKGNFIFENTRAQDIKEGEPCEVVTEHGIVNAKDVIITTNFPFYDKVHPYDYTLGVGYDDTCG